MHSRPRPCPCQGVLGEDGAWIETTARIRDELEDGDHVWIDVGDGNPHPYPNPNPSETPNVWIDVGDGKPRSATATVPTALAPTLGPRPSPSPSLSRSHSRSRSRSRSLFLTRQAAVSREQPSLPKPKVHAQG